MGSPLFAHRSRPVQRLLDGCEYAEVAVEFCRQSRAAGVGDRQALRREALIVEFAEMVPAAGGEIAGEGTSADADVVVPTDLADYPRRIVEAKCQAVIVETLRVVVSRRRRTAVEHSADRRHLIGQRGLDAH